MFITTIHNQDVWKVQLFKASNHPTYGSYLVIGYRGTKGRFYYSDVRTATSLQEEEEVIKYYKKRLRQFTTQQEFSIKLFNYLKNPKRKLQNIEISYNDLLYRGVPIPILRDDFPNRAEILMALDTKVHYVNATAIVVIWGIWLEGFRNDL